MPEHGDKPNAPDPLQPYRESFNRPPLSESERLRLRHAAIFAVMTFNPRFLQPNKWDGLNVTFTEQELTLARDFIDNQKPSLLATLPTPYHVSRFHNHAERYYKEWAKDFSLIIPHNLKYGLHQEGVYPDCQVGPEEDYSDHMSFLFTHHPDESLLLEDPSGRSLIRAAIERAQRAMGLRRLGDIPRRLQAEAEFVVADQVFREEEKDPPTTPNRLFDENDTEEEFRRKFNQFILWYHYQRREHYRDMDKAAVGLNTGYVLDAEGNIIHQTLLGQQGIQLACTQYLTAVELYLSHYGIRTTFP